MTLSASSTLRFAHLSNVRFSIGLGVRAWLAAAFVVASSPIVGPVSAQSIGVVQSDILVLDQERLFESTELGQTIASGLQVEREAIIARNRALESELEAEEQELTDLRPSLSPEEFRELADRFDEKVQEIRRDSERRVRDLERNRERAPIEFMRQVEPVLIELMRESGAVVILDQRSVLLRDGVVDITSIAAARIDQRFPGSPAIEDAPSQSNEN